MANTVPNLSYANTFGEWVTATSALIGENNRLAASDYTKDSGTLYLNETTQNSLQANGSVVIQKQLNVQGTGSSASIQNNLGVGGLLTLSNATYSLSAAGQANISGPVYATGSGTGLTVANNVVIGRNTAIGGNTTITYNTITDTVQSNTLVNTTTVSVTGGTYTGTLQSNNSVNTSNASIVNTLYTKYLQANSSINTATASITGTTYTGTLQANTVANTQTLSVTQTGFLDVVQANSAVNTTTSSVTQTAFARVVQANTSANTQTLSVTQTAFVNTLQANTSTNTENLSVTQTARVRTLQANTSANTETLYVTQTGYLDVVQANSAVNTRTLSVTGTGFVNLLQANAAVNTENLSVTQTARVRTLQANTSANTQTLSVTQTGFLDTVQANTTINTTNMWATTNVTANVLVANNYIRTPDIYSTNVSVTGALGGTAAAITGLSAQIGSGGMSVQGNFTINGSTIYNTNQFVLSALTQNQISYFGVYRTNNALQLANSVNANAYVRWNETQRYWDVNDVLNTDTATSYSRLLTANSISDNSTSTSTSTVPTSNLLTITYSKANSAGEFANGAFGQANSAASFANGAFGQANSAASFANGAFARANSSFVTANSAASFANAAFTKANNAIANTDGVRTVGSVTIGGSLTVVSDATISGNLTVSGTTTYVNTQTLMVGDNIVVLNADLPAANLPTENAGIEVNRGANSNTYIYWDETQKWWVAKNNVAEYKIANTTTYLTEGTNLYLTATRVRANVTNTAPINYDSSTGTFSHADSGVTAKTYGDSSNLVSIVVNATGHVTSVSNVALPVNTLQAVTTSGNTTDKVVSFTNTTASTSNSTGALKISGGLGVAGNVYATAVYDNGSRAVTMVGTNAASPLTSTNYAPGAFSISHDDSGVTAATHGRANTVPVITVNATGHITSVSNTAIAIASGAVSGLATSATTDTTNATNITSGTLAAARLATSGVTAATHGSSINIPVFVVDDKGRVTSVSNTEVRTGSTSQTGVLQLTDSTSSTSTTTAATPNSVKSAYDLAQSAYNAVPGSSSNPQFNSLGVGTAASGTAGEIRATGDITAGYSDDRLKDKLGNIGGALDKVTQLNGFYYRPNETAQDLGFENKLQVGVSAQEVFNILPEVVKQAPIDPIYLTVDYEKLVPLLIEAIKELKAEIDQLKGK